MADETNDLSSQEDGIDNVELSESDDAETWDYFDPDEDQDDEEAPEDEATDDEPDEDVEEAAEDEAEDDDQEAEEPAASELADDVRVKLPDGSTVTFGELKESPMLKADHTRKTQEIANQRKTVKADVERMQRITEAFVDHVSSLVPEAPDASLALSDPNKYTAQKAQYEAAMEQVRKLIELGDAPKEIAKEMNDADRQERLREANQQLIDMFPEAAGGKTREAFFTNVQTVANDLGFSNEELGQVEDPRIFALAHWAKKGMEAEKAKAKAKEKVAKAPPAAPRKPGTGAGKRSGNREAMRKLSRSGSIQDAMAVDFD